MPNQMRITNMTTKPVMVKLSDIKGNFTNEIVLKLAQKQDFDREQGVYKLSILNIETRKEEYIFNLKSAGVYQIDRNYEYLNGFKIKNNLTSEEIFHSEVKELNRINDTDRYNNTNENFYRNSNLSSNDFFILNSKNRDGCENFENSNNINFNNSINNNSNSNNKQDPFKKDGVYSSKNANFNNSNASNFTNFNLNLADIPKGNLLKIKNESNKDLIIYLFRDKADIAPECSFISNKQSKFFNRAPRIEYELIIEFLTDLQNDSSKESIEYNFVISSDNNYTITNDMELLNEKGFIVKNQAKEKKELDEKDNITKSSNTRRPSSEIHEIRNSFNENYKSIPLNIILLKNSSEKDYKVIIKSDKNPNLRIPLHLFAGLFNRITVDKHEKNRKDLNEIFKILVNDEFFFNAKAGFKYDITDKQEVFCDDIKVEKNIIPANEKESFLIKNPKNYLCILNDQKNYYNNNMKIIENNKYDNNDYADFLKNLNKNYLTEYVSKKKTIKKKTEFIINNSNTNEINVRIETDGFASEDFFFVRHSEKKYLSRMADVNVENQDDNKENIKNEIFYLLEILDEENNSIRFYISKAGEYIFTSEKKLIYKQSSEEIEPTDDLIDEETKTFMARDGKLKDIKYNKGFFTDLGKKTLKLFDFSQNNNNNENKTPTDNNTNNTTNVIYNKNSKTIVKDEDKNLTYFENILPNYIPGQVFTDVNFAADSSMIDPNSSEEPNKMKFRKAHFTHSENEANLINFSSTALSFLGGFQRPNKIFKKQFYLFKDNIEPSDVIQGTIGNCYLVSIFAALAERPELIQKIFKTRSINPDGFYEIYYYYKGRKYIMFIDDIFPTFDKNLGSKKLLFAEPNEEEIWVSILEKAYAKFEGGYKNIIGGLIYPELEFFTGCKTEELDIVNSKLFWDKLKVITKDQNIICCRSKFKNQDSNNKNSITSNNNIVFGHAYTILDAREMTKDNNDQNKNIKLVQIRNPYGASHHNINGDKIETEWNGDYSDNSPLWNDDLKKFFDYHIAKGDNGIFFMSFDDFVKEFDSVVIGYI